MPPPRITSSVASHLSTQQQQVVSEALKEQDKDLLANNQRLSCEAVPRTL
jgi:hypothetical protein